MQEDRLPRSVFESIPQRKRKRGQPMTTWKENVQTAIHKSHLEEDLVYSRKEWKRAIGRCVTQ